MTTTIAAIATPAGCGAIAVIRISGAEAFAVVDAFFTADRGGLARDRAPRAAYLGTARLEGFDDRCICTLYPAPRSYTGEDMAELSCHGGAFVARAVLAACLRAGARQAAAGEFTRRAFVNGKLSLTGAEGIIDLINAESAAEARAAGYLAAGALTREAGAVQDTLVDLIAAVEAAIDYPDDADFFDKDKLSVALAGLLTRLDALIGSYAYGKLLREGLTAVIAGRPNAGKSSLYNALLRYDRSIVAPVAGTTRDAVSERLQLKDVKINLIDTAGLRAGGTADPLERLGMEKSEGALTHADVVLYVFDVREGVTAEDKRILAGVGKDKKIILIANKCDLLPRADKRGSAPRAKNLPAGALAVSALKAAGIERISDALYACVQEQNTGADITLTNERHRLLLAETRRLLSEARAALPRHTADLVAADLGRAYRKLGELTGTAASEEIIDRIFSTFCLGK